MHKSITPLGPNPSAGVPMKTIEHQLGMFTDTWQSAVANLPLEAAITHICDDLQAIASHAFEDMENDFDPILWPNIEGLARDVQGIAEDELDAAVRTVLLELGPRIIMWVSEDIEAYLECVSGRNAERNTGNISRSGAHHG